MTAEELPRDDRQPGETRPQFVTKRDYAVNVVRKMIAAGELKPGEHLRQDELSERLQVSSTPMREALLLLQAEGLLNYSPHKGVRVHQFTPAEEVEAYQIRVALEPLAVRLAVPQMTDAHLRQVHDLHLAMIDLAKAGRWDEYVRSNRRFHRVYLEAAGSPLLDELITRVWARAPWRIPVTTPRGREAVAEHESLVRATLARDAEAAALFMEKHLEETLIYARMRCRRALPPAAHARSSESEDRADERRAIPPK
ncbi:MAG: GntR family transcriptional regulator [Chloroflexi bacterium]|nr:GntR family transcriptional regulator [Chloroflexota bacterium]